jgi:nitrogenase subunit NifH
VLGFIPRSPEIEASEVDGRTVTESAPGSAAAAAFRALAEEVLAEEPGVVPRPLELEELEAIYRGALERPAP